MRGPQRPGSSADGNLPLELTAFVGRSAELGELARALESARLVTVTGVETKGTGPTAETTVKLKEKVSYTPERGDPKNPKNFDLTVDSTIVCSQKKFDISP